MATVYDVNGQELVVKAAEELKKSKNLEMPDWAKVVKTGAGQERVPTDPEWWYKRAASVLRRVYMRGPIGVSKLRTLYGTRKNRGTQPEIFYKGAGKIIRTILQQLEKEELIKQTEKGVHKGRVVTPKGKSLLDKCVAHGSRGTKKAKDVGAAAERDATATEAASAAATTD